MSVTFIGTVCVHLRCSIVLDMNSSLPVLIFSLLGCPSTPLLSRYLDAIQQRVKFKQSVLMDCARETLFDFVIQLILGRIYRYAESWMWMLRMIKSRACSRLNRKFPWFLVHSSNFNLVFFPSRNWNRSCVACIQAQALLPILKFCLFVSCLMAVVKLPG